ncbi:Armadillo repeat superfamily protein [Klebsormidium nitens]|uniref:Protein MOR1 n=1 Tax=Klebsormidium nitens TaxID=105231 RepID=A0A1Y1IDS9_KLENI|nr:Armadillo repeat superfamily protein [Klebsormidium nitens]|eukprot:GAQ86856.1 Armadillo repeat superfamily protein [Klebsormidium nitens]
MAENEEAILKDAKKLPLEDRLAHKHWKARVQALEDIAVTCDKATDPKDPKLREYGPLFKKALSDSNAAAQEKALDALIAFLKRTDTESGRYAREVNTVLVSKCFTGRPKTIAKATEAIELFVELEASEAVVEVLIKGFDNKLAKVIIPVIDALFSIISQFGTKVVNVRPILSKDAKTDKLYFHSDQKVRAAAKGLTKELARWIGVGPVNNALVDKMPDVMKKELEAELAELPAGAAAPTRRIRSEQDKPEEVIEGPAPGAAADGAAEETKAAVPDEWEYMEPFDLLSTLKNDFWQGVVAKKWSDKKDVIVKLSKEAEGKKLAPGDYSELTRTLKKLMTDSNVSVTTEAITAAGHLAKGLRKGYTAGSRNLLTTLLEKFKEKKAQVVKEAQSTLQIMYTAGCLDMVEIQAEVEAALKHKVPSVKSETLAWITFCIDQSPKPVVIALHKADMTTKVANSLVDGTVEVREAAFLALAAIAKKLGMGPLNKIVDTLDEVKKKKLMDIVAAVTGTAPAATGPAAPTSSGYGQTSGSAAAPTARMTAAGALSGKRPALKPVAKKVNTGGPATKKGEGAGPAKSAAPSAAAEEEVSLSEMSKEEIEAKVAAILQPETVAKLKSSVWKERVQGVEEVAAVVANLKEGVQEHAELLLRLLALTPGWKESNAQALQKTFDVAASIASASPQFPKRGVVICMPGLVDKIGDAKMGGQVKGCLTAFCEAVGPQFVFSRLYKPIAGHTNQKNFGQALEWMGTAIEDFGVGMLNLKDLLDFCKAGLDSPNNAVRTSATKLLGTIHKYKGPDIKSALGDVKPALMSAVEAEFTRNPYEGPAAAPKRQVKVAEAVVAGNGELPREDISGKITEAMLTEMASTDWKVRQAAIESVNQVIEDARKRIQPAGLGDLFAALKGRLNDSNKNLVVSALAVLASLAAALGPGADKTNKSILTEVLKCMSDNKKLVRDAALKTMDAWLEALSLDKLVPYLVVGLAEPKISADGRKELYEWTAKQVPVAGAGAAEAAALVKPCASALQDKSADVRKAAEALTGELVQACGYGPVSKAARDLQSKNLAVLQPILDKLKGVSSAPASPGDSKPSTSARPQSAPQRKNESEAADPSGRPRTAAAKAGGVRTSQALPSRLKKQDADDAAAQSSVPLIQENDLKEERARRAPRRIKFDDQRDEELADLEACMQPIFREDLYKRLTSAEFKDHVAALDLLTKGVPQYIKAMTDNLDVLLRWSVVRICEANTSSMLKTVEFLEALLDALKGQNYHLSDYEAGLFIPCLVEKSGHQMKPVQQSIRKLMRQITMVYPASKFFAFLVEGVRSKNNRTRIECVDEVGNLMDRHGVEIVGSTKALQVIAAITAERDVTLRNVSLLTLTTAYKILGDDVWKQLGKLTDAQKGLIEDKFRWKAKEMEKKKEGRPGEARAEVRRSRTTAVSSAADTEPGPAPQAPYVELPEVRSSGDVGMPSNLRVSSDSGFARRENGLPSSAHSSRASTPTETASTPTVYFEQESNGSGDAAALSWQEALDRVIGSPDQDQVIEGLKWLCYELTSAVQGGNGALLAEYTRDAEQLVQVLTDKVQHTFTQEHISTRLCKYVLNTLMQIFQIKSAATSISAGRLKTLVVELLLWLLDDRVPRIEAGNQLLKALNVLMLKILENTERTSSFVILISLLRPSGVADLPSARQQDVIADRGPRFTDLVVKCLIKLTKALSLTIHDVDLDKLLRSIHDYLEDLGIDEIRKRAGADDKPLRMVKTVLHELVKLKGIEIKAHLSLVPGVDLGGHPGRDQPIIMAYIDLNLQTMPAAPPPRQDASPPLRESAPPATPQPVTLEQIVKPQLAAIFNKIGRGAHSDEGMAELYALHQQYPRLDVFAHMGNCSDHFRLHIREGLSRMAAKAADGQLRVADATDAGSEASPPKTLTLPRTPEGQAAPDLEAQFKELEAQMPTVTGEREQARVQSTGDAESRTGGQEPVAAGGSKLRMPQAVRRPAGDLEQAGEPTGGTPRAAENGAGGQPSVGTLDALKLRMRAIQAQAASSPTEPLQNGIVSKSFEFDRGQGFPATEAQTSPGGTVTIDHIKDRLARLHGNEPDA